MSIQERYQEYLSSRWSDVQAHLPRFYEAAKGTVLELGVRFGVSTTAFLAGVETHGGTVWSVDHDPACADRFDHPQWRFVLADSRDIAKVLKSGMPAAIDTLFIDTGHTFEITLSELNIWGPLVNPGGVMLLHDTEDGMTAPGVINAMEYYCNLHDLTYELVSESYGLGIIRKPL